MYANDFLIGCDPEFLVIDKKPQIKRVSDFHLRGINNIGTDHAGWVGELRPNPARSVFKLIKNLKEIISNVSNRFPRTHASFAAAKHKYATLGSNNHEHIARYSNL